MVMVQVNNKDYTVDVSPGTPLLWVLRETLGLTGTKFGCGMVLCSARTVHLDGEAVQSCVTPVSRAAGKDPYEFRRTLLVKHPRHKGVLELAAGKAAWGQALPEGRGRGLAVHESFGSFVAQVAEVEEFLHKMREWVSEGAAYPA